MPSIDKARTDQVKEEVQRKLEGLPERQAQRNAARAMLARIKMVQKVRRQGGFANVEMARQRLTEMGLMGTEESYYGIVLLHSTASVTLAFDREGRLSWTSRPIRQYDDVTQEAFEFSDELLASGDEDFLSLLDGLH